MQGPLVDAAWLSDHLDDVVVCDVRWYLDGRSGRAAYDAGHIPSAIFVDLDHDLSGAAGGTAGRHPLPDPAAFAESMGRLGIGDGTQVVAYDDTSGANAARLVWMLRVLGEQAALLDGGLRGVDGAALTRTDRARPGARSPHGPGPPRRSSMPTPSRRRSSAGRSRPSTPARASATGARSSPSTPAPATSRARGTCPGPHCSIPTRGASVRAMSSGNGSPRRASMPMPPSWRTAARACRRASTCSRSSSPAFPRRGSSSRRGQGGVPTLPAPLRPERNRVASVARR